MKDIKILGLVFTLVLGVGFEGLKNLNIRNQSEDEIGKAGEVFSIYRESTQPLDKKNWRRPHSQPAPQVQNSRGVKFDLKAAISNYQQEHGLEEHNFGAKKRPDKLKASKDKKKKKKASKYEYVFDRKTGKWIKRRKMTKEQRERLMAQKQEEFLKKMKEKSDPIKTAEQDSNSGLDSWSQETATTQNANQDQKEDQDEQKSYEQWAQLLLQYPNKVGLSELVEAYRSSKVSSDIFFRIAQELLQDPRFEMKKEGLLLVDFFPSVPSFRLGVMVLDTEESFGEIRAEAQKILYQDYASLSGLHVLSKVMKLKEDSHLLIMATNLLKSAMDSVLTPTEVATHSSHFQPFLNLLSELTHQEEGQVVSLAARTLTELQNRIQGQSVAALP